MYVMSETSHLSDPQDICLLLRTHGEQRWLVSQVLPVLQQIETPRSIPDDQLGAALAYLKLLWIDACRRARETDAAYAKLHQHHLPDETLYEKASRYHAAVRRLRLDIGQRVAHRTRFADGQPDHEHARR